VEIIYSFSNQKNNCNQKDERRDKALIELYLINNILTEEEFASGELFNRCVNIKNSLVEFPKFVSKVNDFSELEDTKWAYEPLLFNYRGRSSVRLTRADRLIFDESTYGIIVIIETLLHYKEGLTRVILEEELRKSIQDKNEFIENMYQKLAEDIFKLELKELDKRILDNNLNLELFDLLEKHTPNNLEGYNKIASDLFNEAKKDTSKIWFFD